MYIAPNGRIWLLHNVPIDKTYQNTLYWPLGTQASVGKRRQLNYFIGDDTGSGTSFVKYSFTQQYYTRHERGSIRVAVLADNIFDCNYLVFQNLDYGEEKYFFAFITSIEYINNSVSQINFEIDVIQTWYFDYNLEPTFIERTHARNDEVGLHIVDEPVEPGEYVYSKLYDDPSVTGTMVVIVGIVDTSQSEGASAGNLYGKIYGGATLHAFNQTDVTGINTLISSYKLAPDSVVAMYLAPRALLRADLTIPSGGVVLDTTDIKTGTMAYPSANIPQRNTSAKFGNYTPHNNKLYTYPFTLLEVFTPQGGKADFRYEFFDGGRAAFRYGGSVLQPVELTLFPTNYKNTREEDPEDPDVEYSAHLLSESLTLSGYPLCSWNNDTFKAWVAQNTIPTAINGLGLGLKLGIATAFGGPIGTAIVAQNIVSQATNMIQSSYEASIAADQLHGQTRGSSAVSMNDQSFFFARLQVNEASARIIDSYFDRFGYAVKKIQEPIRKNRKFYTYIKTIGCTITGSIPADDEDKICTIHDNGITYWDANETRQIGNYGLADGNTPIIDVG